MNSQEIEQSIPFAIDIPIIHPYKSRKRKYDEMMKFSTKLGKFYFLLIYFYF